MTSGFSDLEIRQTFVLPSREQRRRLWERVAAQREAGGAVVFATQNLEEVELVANRVAALRDGRLVFTGTRDEYDRAHVESLSA